MEIIFSNFYWTNMHKEIKNYVQSCIVYQKAKSETKLHAELLHPLPIPSQVGEVICMEFITTLPPSHTMVEEEGQPRGRGGRWRKRHEVEGETWRWTARRRKWRQSREVEVGEEGARWRWARKARRWRKRSDGGGGGRGRRARWRWRRKRGAGRDGRWRWRTKQQGGGEGRGAQREVEVEGEGARWKRGATMVECERKRTKA